MQPTPEPVFLNLEYIFFQLYKVVGGFFRYLFSVNFLITLKILATILIILLIAAIIYSYVRIYELQKEGNQKPAAAPSNDAPAVDTSTVVRNEIWEAVRAKLLSDSPSDWRLAIIEADIYLDKVLDSRGFHGDTLGDKFKQISPSALNSIQLAWEAHKVRNRIAHEGSAFTLTQPEARRVLSYYEIIFRDLGVIE
jgi:hypothetical protein